MIDVDVDYVYNANPVASSIILSMVYPFYRRCRPQLFCIVSWRSGSWHRCFRFGVGTRRRSMFVSVVVVFSKL